MENASRALIIAGATFIAVLILTTMIYLFRAAAKTNENYDERQAQQQLQLFNSKFEQYNREENTIIDMESLINLAYNTNEENEYDSERNVRIAIKIIDGYYIVIPEVKTSSLNKNEIYRVDDPKKAFRRLKAGYTEANPEYEEINVGQKMNTYRLINSSLGSIGIDNTRIKKKDQNKASDTFSTSDSDFLSISQLITDSHNRTITNYKFLFRCLENKTEYHKISGRVSYMEFELVGNNVTWQP